MARRISRREALKYSAATGAMATGLAGVPRLVAAADPLKVGIVYVSPISEIGWTKQHSLGAEAIANTFGELIQEIRKECIHELAQLKQVDMEATLWAKSRSTKALLSQSASRSTNWT